MKPRSNMNGIWMGFDIFTSAGRLARPEKIVFWDAAKFKNQEPEDPFHYSADALLGLSMVHLNKNLQNPFSTPKMNYAFAHEAWQALEPHHELFTRAQPRVQALRDSFKPEKKTSWERFEQSFSNVLENCVETWGFSLEHVGDLLEWIDHLETNEERPLLYNFKMRFSRETVMQMHYLHSMLFNLRTLIAMDYNAHIQDAAHEAVKVDSISDYLPKADYVANDALLYWTFKKTRDQMPKAAAEQMEKAFFSYSHNGAALIESLPKSFLQQLNREELEETLYLVQMDWLLGTDAGLLFRLREELFGLVDGYDQVFYPDMTGKPKAQGGCLSINCQITEETLYPNSEAA